MARMVVSGWMERKYFDGRDLVACKIKTNTIDCLELSSGTLLIAKQCHCLETTLVSLRNLEMK